VATQRERELERLLREERARGERLERTNARLEKKLDEMLERQEKLQQQIRELVREISELRRAAKRQATPSAHRKRKKDQLKPGRKAGHPGASQATPDQVDEQIFAPLKGCPWCGSKVPMCTITSSPLWICRRSRLM
jgi:DNA repair exonuclease SbcCD ATPase subunit